VETMERTVDGWAKLAEKDLLTDRMRSSISNQIHSVAKSTA
jgi:hypothetical protein